MKFYFNFFLKKKVYWSDTAEFVTIASESTFYILKYNKAILASFEGTVGEEGIEDSFEVLYEISERYSNIQYLKFVFF